MNCLIVTLAVLVCAGGEDGDAGDPVALNDSRSGGGDGTCWCSLNRTFL